MHLSMYYTISGEPVVDSEGVRNSPRVGLGRSRIRSVRDPLMAVPPLSMTTVRIAHVALSVPSVPPGPLPHFLLFVSMLLSGTFQA